MLTKSTNFQIRKRLCSLLLLTLPFLMTAQTSSGQLWTTIEESEIPEVGKRYIIPTQYQTLKLDVDKMRATLGNAPMTKTTAVKEQPAYVEIPWPDGSMKTFQIIEAPVMEAELAAKYPEIKTYKGSEVGDPSKYIRLDLTPQGFHAMVLTDGEGTVYVDPYTFGGGDMVHYLSYYKADFSPIAGKTMVCGVRGNPVNTNDFRPTPGAGSRFGSCELRTYRLALAATGEYTQFHGGTVALALAAQNTSMNRVNAVYNRDMAIQMTIIANNNLIIYTNGATDPYTNNSGGVMLNENQTNVDAIIGAANYDIGHVYSTGGGGIAQLYSPCSSNKARGVTGSSAPVNDPFDIDYVCHEIGHQFGGNHTQNNSCNRNNATSMEPGSASTIMGYAGICAPNVQSNSDDHFHGITLQEIGAFITGSGHTCPVKTPLGNSAPTVTGTNAAGVTIPGSTPFALTATATDPDANTLTYCWEQMDNAVSTQSPVGTSTDGPNFRSLPPSTNSTRYFPNLADLSSGTPTPWEVLATVNRNMDFRVSVRDNAVGGGCTDNGDITVTIDGSSGPFILSYPSIAGITWGGLTTEIVTWNVAGTDIAPVACANVDILLSTDGGLTYPTVLANNVPNDGSQSVTVPNVGTTTARIMVICANGTFFDISDNNFTITVSTSDYTLSASPDTASACQPANVTYAVTIGQVGPYSDPVTLSVTGVPAGATATFGTNPVGTPGATTLIISNTGAAAAGVYNLTLTGSSTSGIKNYPLVLNITGTPGAVTLTAPANGATGVAVPTTFNWTASGTPGEQYDIDIASDAGFATIVDNATGLATPTYVTTALNLGTNYFWRVRGTTACGNGPFSTTFSFTSDNCGTFTSTNIPVAISASGTPTVTSNLNIPITGTITDVNVLNLAGTHSFINDLTITLTSPATTSVDLWDRICNNENDFDINIDDGAAAGALPCPPVGGGTFQPSGSLANFNGQNPNGNWILTITDAVNQDGGQLNTWALEVCVGATATCAVTASQTNVSCNGGADGTATAVPTGTAPFGFVWTGGQTNATATGLTAGVYTVTMTDGTTCSSTATVTITAPTAMSSAPTQTAETCATNDGTATANGTGGTGTLTYLWSNGQTNNTATGLATGSFNYTITDANACTSTGSISVINGCIPCTMTASAVVDNNVFCNGGTDGQATASQSGGTGPISFVWSNGQTNASATGLVAGVYTVTLTDNNACTATASATITAPTVLTFTTSSTVESCANNDGTATVVVAGGTLAYTYQWAATAGSQATATATGLTTGTYGVTTTDGNGCTTSTTVTVIDGCAPCTMTASAVVDNNVSCNGGADGQATASQSGGTGPINFVWSNGQTNASATGLVAGVYTVTLTDNNACTATGNVTITAPTALTFTTSSTVESCANNDGTATVTVAGGTLSYTYQWAATAGSQATATATGLTTGTYGVTTTDGNGCTTSTTVTVIDGCVPCTMTASTVVDNNVSCNGGSNGQATASQSGGTGPISFVWSNGQTNASATALIAGIYTVTLTDNNTCTATASITIAQPNSALSSLVTGAQNPLCNGNSNGSITVNAFGGTTSYSFDIGAGGQTTGVFTGLTGGVYTVTVTDANGCTSTAATALATPAAITASATIGTAVSCTGNADGTAVASAFGGSPGFSFTWPNGQSTATATGLAAGTHTVTATDANGCIGTASVTLTAPVGLTATAVNGTSISCNGGSDGTAIASGTGGTGTYSFVWSNGQTNATVSGLGAGTHFVTVSDANGCSDVSSVVLLDPVGMISSAVVTSNFNGEDVSCTGASDGSAIVNVVNGTSPYTFLWSPSGQTNQTATGLSAGAYVVIITDASGCTSTANVTLAEPSVVTASAVDNGNGTATASAVGGTPSYTYQWDAAAGGQITATATGLINNGTYTVTITDANGCTTTANVTVIISGLDNVPNLSLFDVVPNPNTGAFTIRIAFTEAKDATVRLTNVLGQVLREYNYSDMEYQIPIDVQHQASGVYFVTLHTKDQFVTRKVIVAK